ncbi:unnamed protein product, partial [marine sediment metagenome]
GGVWGVCYYESDGDSAGPGVLSGSVVFLMIQSTISLFLFATYDLIYSKIFHVETVKYKVLYIISMFHFLL